MKQHCQHVSRRHFLCSAMRRKFYFQATWSNIASMWVLKQVQTKFFWKSVPRKNEEKWLISCVLCVQHYLLLIDRMLLGLLKGHPGCEVPVADFVLPFFRGVIFKSHSWQKHTHAHTHTYAHTHTHSFAHKHTQSDMRTCTLARTLAHIYYAVQTEALHQGMAIACIRCF